MSKRLCVKRALSRTVFLFYVFSAWVCTDAAQAFHLTAHTKITQRALNELPADSPLRAWQDRIVDCCLNEDKNLWQKWFVTSHYYDPIKSLPRKAPTWRTSALERVKDLLAQLLQSQNMGERACLIGKLIHHFQDVSVPAHVIPVAHGFSDGFESYTDQSEAVDWALALDFVAEPMFYPLTEFYHQAALETWIAAQQVPWSRFWVPNGSPGFGRYGEVGNRFGDPALLPLADYDAFLFDRVSASIRWSIQLLSSVELRL